MKPFDWNAGRNWVPLLTLPANGYIRNVWLELETRINPGLAYWLDEIGSIDWSGLPVGWLVR